MKADDFFRSNISQKETPATPFRNWGDSLQEKSCFGELS